MSIEVLHGEFPTHLWVEAHGDNLVEAALQCGVIEWRWQHFDWGVVLEIDFADEGGWERFRMSTAVQAALDAVPDRLSGVLIIGARAAVRRRECPENPSREAVLALSRWSPLGSGCSSRRTSRNW